MGDLELIEKAKKEGIELVFDRYNKQKPLCNFGLNGTCCKNCHQGPCRIIPGKSERGICGVNAETIIARNLVRICASGASSHADHAREMLIALYKIAEKNAEEADKSLAAFGSLLGSFNELLKKDNEILKAKFYELRYGKDDLKKEIEKQVEKKLLSRINTT